MRLQCRPCVTFMLATAVFLTLGILGGRVFVTLVKRKTVSDNWIVNTNGFAHTNGFSKGFKDALESGLIMVSPLIQLQHTQYLKLNNVLIIPATDAEWSAIRDAFPTNVVQSTNILVDLRRER